MKKKDSQLLVLISNKDIKSFNAFYHRYSNVIYSFVYRHLNDEVSSDDLVQDFWVKVWEDPSFLKCNESGSVKIYMLQHLKFRILDIYRKTLSQLVRECKIENADNEVVYNGILDEHNERELINIIHEALDTQPQIVKKVFWLRINNWSVEETAKALSVSSKTIYNRYSESLSVVREKLAKHYPEFTEFYEKDLTKRKRAM